MDISQIRYLPGEIRLYSAMLEEIRRRVADRYLAQEIAAAVESLRLRCWLELRALVKFVEAIPDNTIKQALLLHYADGVTWQGIALGFGSGTEATWRIRCKRYLSKYTFLHEA